jgi:hypothetical protein
MTTDTVEAVEALTHEELVVVSDILGRMQTGAENGEMGPIKIAIGFMLKPEFGTALEKIDDAKIATRPGQVMAGKPKLWITAAQTPYGNEYGAVAVIAATREEAIAKAAAKLQESKSTYVPDQGYTQALLDSLGAISEVEDEVFIDWSHAKRRQ